MLRFKAKATFYLAYGLFFGGIALAAFPPSYFVKSYLWATNVACFLGLGYLFFSKLASQRIVTPALASSVLVQKVKLANVRSLISVMMVQILFLAFSWVFFYTMESQTSINTRLQELSPGTIIGLMKASPWSLCVFPWVCYAIFGVTLAYLSICLQRSPTLPKVLFPQALHYPRLFFYYYCKIVVDLVYKGSSVFLFSLTIIWCCNSLNVTFGWPSLFQYPWRAIFSFALIVIVFRKSFIKFLDLLQQRKIPLGGTLVLSALGIALLLFWMNSFGSEFTFGSEIIDAKKVEKSPIAGSFSSEALEIRLRLLIWGWWAAWIPTMASIVARLSSGRRVYEACLNALLFPALFFVVFLQRIEYDFWLQLFPQTLPVGIYWAVSAFLILLLMFLYGQMHTLSDIARIAMPSIGEPLRNIRPTTIWFMAMMSIAVCYLSSTFLLGWVPTQMMVTLAIFFMTTLLFMVLWVLFSTTSHSVDVAKYKSTYIH